MELVLRVYRSSFARFVAAGGVTYLIALATMAFWIGLVGLPNLVAYALTNGVVLAVGFALNRRWTFRATHVDAATQGAWFVAGSVAFRCLDWCVYCALALLLSPPWPLAVLLANGIVLAPKYLYFRHRVFPAARHGIPAVRDGDGALLPVGTGRGIMDGAGGSANSAPRSSQG